MSPWRQRFWRSGVETTATDSLRSSGPSSRIQANVVTSSGPHRDFHNSDGRVFKGQSDKFGPRV